MHKEKSFLCSRMRFENSRGHHHFGAIVEPFCWPKTETCLINWLINLDGIKQAKFIFSCGGVRVRFQIEVFDQRSYFTCRKSFPIKQNHPMTSRKKNYRFTISIGLPHLIDNYNL